MYILLYITLSFCSRSACSSDEDEIYELDVMRHVYIRVHTQFAHTWSILYRLCVYCVYNIYYAG